MNLVILVKIPNITLHENPFFDGRGVPCLSIDRQTYTTELIVPFCNYFIKAPKSKLKLRADSNSSVRIHPTLRCHANPGS